MPDEPENAAPPLAGDIAPGALTEYLTDDWGFFVRSTRQFEHFRSPFQAVEVHDSARVRQAVSPRRPLHDVGEGRILLSRESRPRLRDRASAPTTALIVGGGDGGSAEELLKHPSIKSVTLGEIDLAVVDIARKYLREVHRGAFDDPRLTLRSRTDSPSCATLRRTTT